MAVTGSGTQADPWIVTNYVDFMSLSEHTPADNNESYIQFFDNNHPNQTIDCNSYGSEFKWAGFTAALGSDGSYAPHVVHINLNGTTIKNFIIKENEAMFNAKVNFISRSCSKIIVENGSLRNVFMGSSTSRLAVGEQYSPIEFNNVSFSINNTGSTVTLFSGDTNAKFTIDNCALYLVQAALSTAIMQGCIVTDSDFELHINDQNSKEMFPDCTFTDCRFQGKISGRAAAVGLNADTFVLSWSGMSGRNLGFTNCVIDIDLTDSLIAIDGYAGPAYGVFLAYNGENINTNIICNSHYPKDGDTQRPYSYPSDWNYMPHEGNDGHNIRNGDWLNSQGFTVVEVPGG